MDSAEHQRLGYQFLKSRNNELALKHFAAAIVSEQEKNHLSASTLEEDEMSPRDLVQALLTIRPAFPPLEKETLTLVDKLMTNEKPHLALSNPVINAATLPRIAPDLTSTTPKSPSYPAALSKISLYRGDITRLQVGAIVNAANSALLGCFHPTHRCIDNVIHAAAGPGLRAACFAARGEDANEPAGRCLLTEGYHLPARFVLHTVGPQIAGGRGGPTAEQIDQLRQCYVSCLEAAANEGSIRSVAFCCISTGLFAFPADLAANIAINAVIEWLEANPASPVQHVVFDVFLASDLRLYKGEFAALLSPNQALGDQERTPPPPPAEAPTHVNIPANVLEKISASLVAAREVVGSTAILDHQELDLEGIHPAHLTLALDWLRSHSSLLVCGGAGLSAAAGLDYTSEEICHKLYPTMAQHGFYRFYDAIGKRDWDARLQWGYLFHSTYLSRFHWPRSQIYADLLALSSQSEDPGSSFVFTSNADGMFAQNGFDPQRIYTIQGDYSRLQCLRPCAQDAHFPILPYLEEAIPKTDVSGTQRLPAELVPKCPKCQGLMMLNVRGGDWFLETPHQEQRARYLAFRESALKKATPERPLVILEIGCGFNTPGVIRLPNERLVANHQNVRLIRVNPEYAQVPRAVSGTTAVGLKGNATNILRWFVKHL